MPDDIERLIMTFGLGSSGHDYGNNEIAGEIQSFRANVQSVTYTNPSTNHTQYKREARCGSGEICSDIIEQRGKRSIGEERFGKKLSWNSHPSQSSAVFSSSDTDPLPFEWSEHHMRFRRQSANCGIDTEQYILFLLDTSGSIGQQNFERIKNGVSKLIRLVCRKVRVAVMTFNHEFNVEFCFDCFDGDCSGRSDAIDAIKEIKYRAGWTHTGGATKCACDFFLSEGCGLPLHASCIDVVYITDGKSNDPSLEVCDEVRCLHNRYGVNTYAMGIGHGVNQKELNCITEASNSISIFNFLSFDDFEKKLKLEMLEDRLTKDLFRTPGTETPRYQCIAPTNHDSTAGTPCKLGLG